MDLLLGPLRTAIMKGNNTIKEEPTILFRIFPGHASCNGQLGDTSPTKGRARWMLEREQIPSPNSVLLLPVGWKEWKFSSSHILLVGNQDTPPTARDYYYYQDDAPHHSSFSLTLVAYRGQAHWQGYQKDPSCQLGAVVFGMTVGA